MEPTQDRTPPLILDVWIRAEPAEVREGLSRSRRALARIGFDPERGEEAELMLAEALNNVVEHAYDGREDGRIHLQIQADAGLALFRICDFGCEMPGGHAPSGRIASAPERAALAEGGYGWHLIRRLADTVCYRRCGSSNCLELRLRGASRQDAED
ncbi:ATP-binding protein [Salipiger bermudensis]|uniref:ATP-binding protein n=1 Tax=Salipiger bermudensis TaxID=344736 RepID=UPI001C98FBF7|nr:ATP-binding protein [Salipiger bermudensis]MBY6002669.1 ATP-binding protein [Salipiger bermudensis]